MLNISNIDHLNMSVKNLSESEKFYKKYFNLEVQEGGIRRGKPWSIVGREGVMFLALYESNDPIKVSGINHAGVHVKNLRKVLKVLERENADFYTWNYDGPRGKSLSAYLKDPNGYEWELSEHFGGSEK